MNWHSLESAKIFELTNSSADGLSSDDAKERLEQYGQNELVEKKKRSPWLLFLNQFSDFMILVLVAAAIISGIIGDLTDTIIILVIILLNAIVGFVQEYRAEKAISALKKMAALQVLALRDGVASKIPTAGLVPGDVVLLEAGNSVPADLRLIEVNSLKVDEAALTGESIAVDKISKPIFENELVLGDRLNMAYKGTIITYGRGKGVVMATGMQTEIGKIALMLEDQGTTTPLQKRMTEFGKKLSYLIFFICLLLFGVGMLKGEPPLTMLLLSISLAVAAIPEALPALITIALSRAASRLVRKNALIRKLPAVETLGSVTFICSDKTGTLTVNKMKVVESHESPSDHYWNEEFTPLQLALALNNDVKRVNGGLLEGDPTETALVQYVQEKMIAGQFDSVLRDYERIAEFPFDSDRKCMTTIHEFKGKYLVLSKGAVESIIENLKDPYEAEGLQSINSKWAGNGLRVIAFAYKTIDVLPHPFSYNNVENNFLIAGLAGMMDPPREEVKVAIQQCRTAGIKPVMITGDHPATAAAIAQQIGMIKNNDLVVSGLELQRMSDVEFSEKVEHISVYARVSPEQKLRIIKTLQKKNHFVAMTGDGVNDAPSLKAADIGIAMGITGTDVSKEAAHMILLDDNFSTIVKAVKEGRCIYDNIRKFVKYIMTCNSAEIWTIFLAPLMGLPIPLLPIHILWINLVTDGLPGLALAEEKAEKDIMERPPRQTNESLFADGIAFHILWVGLLMAGLTLSTQAAAILLGWHWQTMVFTVLSVSQLGHVMAIRSEKEYLFRQGIFSNPQLFITVMLTLLLQLVVIYLPQANEVFKTQPLSLEELLVSLGAAGVLFHAVEFEKWVKKRIQAKKSK